MMGSLFDSNLVTGMPAGCGNPEHDEGPLGWCREQDLNLHAFYGTGS